MSDKSGPLRRRMLNDRAEARLATSLPQQRVTALQRVPSPTERRARGLRRTADMVEALHQIDVAPTATAQREIIEWLDEVYESRGGGLIVGLFGHCYLGPPYVDHAFDLGGAIKQHYTLRDPLPAVYAPARPFATSEAYAYIEIYGDGQVIPIRPDGTAVL